MPEMHSRQPDFHLMYLNCSLKIKKEYKNLKELDNGIFMEMN